MIEFIQANASWLVLGALFLFMMRMHGGSGMGCGGGHQHGGDHEEHRPDEDKASLPQPNDAETGKEKEPVASSNNHSGSCH
ncbi:MAG: hypothetical protein M1370_05760 [Bacteroidetes bacterium]|nr:hypothetical protein [Bacteroidota bacterium]